MHLVTVDRLLDDLLTLARADQDRLHDVHRIAIRDLLEDLRRDAPLLGRRHYVIRGCPGTVPVDPEQLQRVLHNLLSNAVRATTENDRIDVTAVPNGERLLLTVSDNGPGIPPDALEAIFERFCRGS